MSRQAKRIWCWFLVATVVLTGCHPMQPFYLHEDGDLSHYLDVATAIEHPDVDVPRLAEVEQALNPLSANNPTFNEFWDLSLEDAISIALQNSKVIRTIRAGGANVQNLVFGAGGAAENFTASPRNAFAPPSNTIYGPALQETDPQTGVEQALAAFDAQLTSNVFWDMSDRPQNLPGGRLFRRDLLNVQTQLAKRAATGTQLFFRNNTVYDDSNNFQNTGVGRAIPSDWLTEWEVEARQPLLRGRGAQVNRIPLVVARIRTDQALAEFELNVTNMVNDVERYYWALYFAYYNLEATRIGHKSAHATWQRIYALYQSGAQGGEAENEAQSREQYFFFRERLEQAQQQVFSTENRLRQLIGLTHTDGRLIRPADEPTTAKVSFDWSDIHSEALLRNANLRWQKWQVKQAELQLTLAKNLLLPQLDGVMLYRWLGLGDGLFTNGIAPFPGPGSTAFDELFHGNYQEGRLGFQLTVPLGFRAELTQVRNRQLELARQTAILRENELEISHLMAEAKRELEYQYKRTSTNLNRIEAARTEVRAIQAAYDAGTATLDRLLDAQRRRSDAEVQYFQTLTNYNIAITNVHLRKGSLLDYNGIVLAEGPWPGKAYFDAHNLARQRDASHFMDYGYSRPKVISRGPITDTDLPGGMVSEPSVEAVIEAEGVVPAAPVPVEPSHATPGSEAQIIPPPATPSEANISSARQTAARERPPRSAATPAASGLGPVLAPPMLEPIGSPPHQTTNRAPARFDYGSLQLDQPIDGQPATFMADSQPAVAETGRQARPTPSWK